MSERDIPTPWTADARRAWADYERACAPAVKDYKRASRNVGFDAQSAWAILERAIEPAWADFQAAIAAATGETK